LFAAKDRWLSFAMDFKTMCRGGSSLMTAFCAGQNVRDSQGFPSPDALCASASPARRERRKARFGANLTKLGPPSGRDGAIMVECMPEAGVPGKRGLRNTLRT
jgi:hypothetical protein